MSFSEQELDELLAGAVGVAEEAGTMLLAGLSRPKQVAYKGEVDLVTEYDTRSEELIRKRLEGRFPGIGMLAEESPDETSQNEDTRWIVDPLDGTTNFSHGQPIFAVSIGLEDGEGLAAGVVDMPALGLTAWARRGGGAFCNGESIRVTERTRLDRSLLATGFPYDRRTARDDNTRELIAFMKSCQGVRRCGAAAVDLAFVARGVYDGFWEPRLHAWDLAAGVVLVREAGGNATDFSGGPLDIHAGWILASNGAIHQRMIETIGRARDTL